MVEKIKHVFAREVFTTKGFPTIEVDVVLEDGALGRAAAPGGTSRGKAEAFDLLDGDPSYFGGLGVRKAILTVQTEISPLLKGKNASDQEGIDTLLIALDGTRNKSRLGGNAMIATSLAVAKAAAFSKGIPLFKYFGGGRKIPAPIIYIMFGGSAFAGMKGVSDFQEFNLIPLGAPTYKDGFIAALHLYGRLSRELAKRNNYEIPRYTKLAGIPIARFPSNEEALSTLTDMIEQEGYAPGTDMGIYLDIAASQFYRNGLYYIQGGDSVLSREEMIDWLTDLCDRYPILSLEDCLSEEDWEGWKTLTKRIGQKVQLVGDDLFVTHPEKLSKGVEMSVANAIVIKPNQIGTLTETIETIKIAKKAEYGTVLSTRSGELWDPYLVHFCVGQNLGQGKLVGAYPTGESNLNEILRVADHLGEMAIYDSRAVFLKFLDNRVRTGPIS